MRAMFLATFLTTETMNPHVMSSNNWTTNNPNQRPHTIFHHQTHHQLIPHPPVTNRAIKTNIQRSNINSAAPIDHCNNRFQPSNKNWSSQSQKSNFSNRKCTKWKKLNKKMLLRWRKRLKKWSRTMTQLWSM